MGFLDTFIRVFLSEEMNPWYKRKIVTIFENMISVAYNF